MDHALRLETEVTVVMEEAKSKGQRREGGVRAREWGG